MLPKEQAWFPAKRFGYGWGLPTRWQGWVVVLAYLAALVVPASLASVPRSRAGYVVYASGLTIVLIAICAWKGEPARWRWGDRDSNRR
jgi:hypothetical protein